MSANMLTELRDTSTGAAWNKGCFMWERPGMLVHLLGRALLRSVQQRLVVKQRCFCAAQSVRCTDTPQQQADMMRNRAQIKRVLCVAEKNDAAKGISEIMSNGRSRRVSHVFWPTVLNPLAIWGPVWALRTCDSDLHCSCQLVDSSGISLSPHC